MNHSRWPLWRMSRSLHVKNLKYIGYEQEYVYHRGYIRRMFSPLPIFASLHTFQVVVKIRCRIWPIPSSFLYSFYLYITCSRTECYYIWVFSTLITAILQAYREDNLNSHIDNIYHIRVFRINGAMSWSPNNILILICLDCTAKSNNHMSTDMDDDVHDHCLSQTSKSEWVIVA
jgi:hypothetical protein